MAAEPLCVRTLHGPADLRCLEQVHGLVGELWLQVPAVPVPDRDRFETAVVEVAGNIVEHSGDDVRLQLRLSVYADRVEACFRDTGCVVRQDPAGPPPDDLAEQGRGLLLARAAVDEVTYERTGSANHWQVLQRRHG